MAYAFNAAIYFLLTNLLLKQPHHAHLAAPPSHRSTSTLKDTALEARDHATRQRERGTVAMVYVCKIVVGSAFAKHQP